MSFNYKKRSTRFCYKQPLKKYKKALIYSLFLCLGSFWILLRSAQLLSWSLPEKLENKPITLSGTIASIPDIQLSSTHIHTSQAEKNSFHNQMPPREAQFLFALDHIDHQASKALIDLRWYDYKGTPLSISDHWQFVAKLKPPHSLMNLGGFDYEQWLFSKGIRATGYILNTSEAIRLKTDPFHHFIDALREHIHTAIKASIPNQPTEGLISALSVGMQTDITDTQWQIMRNTGTNHLMAIAGVHIAFVSSFFYFIIHFLWRRQPKLALWLPTPYAAKSGSFLSALLYSMLAGFSLPTQRALSMLSIFVIGTFFRRNLSPWHVFSLSLFLVLILDPLCILSVSFWLSFSTVAAIIYGMQGRLHAQKKGWQYFHIQWIISLSLIPLSLMLFHQCSFVSLISNLVAIPIVGIFILPLTLTGTFFLNIWPTLAHYLLTLSAYTLFKLWQLLGHIGQLQGAVWFKVIPHLWIFIAATLSILFLLAPRGFPMRWMGLFFCMPLILYKTAPPPLSGLRFTLLDVGQGLSTVIQTQSHTLVFDTGPPMGVDDAGNRIVVPFLKARDIHQIDTLIISHPDSDHMGGASTLLKQIPVKQILTSVPERFEHAITCTRGQTWIWDGILFEILYPTPEWLHQDNNSSCVLHVKTPMGYSFLLTGDIEKPAEDELVAHIPAKLSATVLIAPHHGSLTSSTPAFVQWVDPRYVLFPTGYLNPYRLPHKTVIQRYLNRPSQLLNTAQDGAIEIESAPHQPLMLTTQRAQHKHLWNG